MGDRRITDHRSHLCAVLLTNTRVLKVGLTGKTLSRRKTGSSLVTSSSTSADPNPQGGPAGGKGAGSQGGKGAPQATPTHPGGSQGGREQNRMQGKNAHRQGNHALLLGPVKPYESSQRFAPPHDRRAQLARGSATGATGISGSTLPRHSYLKLTKLIKEETSYHQQQN